MSVINATDRPEDASFEADLRALGQRIAELYAQRADIRPRPDDDRPRLPAPVALLRQVDANDLEAMVDAAFREYEAAVPAFRDAPGPVYRDAPIPVIHDATMPAIRDAPAVANDVTPAPEPVEVDVDLDSALINYLAPEPCNDVEGSHDTRYSYVNEDAIPTPRQQPSR